MTSSTIITYQAVLSNIAYNYALPPASVSNEITIVGNPTSTSSIFTASPWTFTLSTGYETSKATIYTLFTPDGSQWPSAVAVIPTFTYPAAVTYPSTGLAARQGVQTGSISIATITTVASGPAVTFTSVQPVTSTSARSTAASSTSTSSTSSQGSSASTTATPPPSKDSGLSKGAKAGIAIGCVLGALLVAGIVAFVCFRRRRKTRNARNPYANETRVSKTDGESYKLATSTVTSKSRQLPQPESDQTISRLANRTLDDIELFVEHYYVDRSVKSTEINATNMLPFSSPYLGSPLADIVRKSSHPTGIFKHCIAYYLLQKIDPAHNKSMSLLPKHFIMPAKGDRKALSQRRVEIAHSRPDIAEDKDYLLQRDRATEEIIQQIERAFQPWARGNTQERAKNLNGTLAHLSELGQKLFAQPATFEWRWRLPDREQTVMLPGLDKLTDSEAVTLATPISLVQPRTGVQ